MRDEVFCFTYCDGVTDMDITALIAHHRAHGRLGTVTAMQPPGRYGALKFGDNAAVSVFSGEASGDGGWINRGFFVLEPEVIHRIEGDATIWELDLLRSLAADGLPPHLLHAADGHVVRSRASRGALGRGQGLLKGVVMPDPVF